MRQRMRFTIQERTVDDVPMTSTTTAAAAARYPVKAKSLTLLELCQTINDFRHASSRDTAQLLTRRLYLHPLIIRPNAKQQTSKIITNNLLQANQSNEEKTTSNHKKLPLQDLAILSSSLSLTTRSNSKMNSSIITDNDESNEYTTSTATSSFNQMTLPPSNRHTLPLLKKRTISTRSIYLPHKRPINVIEKNPKKHFDIWHHFNDALERPIPKDPPTTPRNFTTDFDLYDDQGVESQDTFQCSSIQEIQIYK